ncbi:Glyco_hydro_28 domain-containing protein [Cephalotus follicularis]|uniref:Glyco_hydro_28 domain-containing protein n=1 Tax=Cephalotus follicularis TaxID=3775 RepID=A0A1Q3D482_CEPFO|nr:Glyco_hydro_28 domain-containing protein [Cephalotus follicularis]GAV87254.1 Glyco_hydro_28 domain-containing protein [Cephalotus follicularis]
MASLPTFFSLIFALVVCILVDQAIGKDQTNIFNVVKYGAVADGKTDDSKAILDAWSQACEFNGSSVVLIPHGKYMVGPMVLTGPCKGSMEFMVQGDLQAPTDEASRYLDHWITFRYTNQLILHGGGTFDGQGASAWAYNNCLRDPHCKKFPVSLRWDFVTNSSISNINMVNSKNFHINLFACQHVEVRNVTITAPGNSPNTDGIHIAVSKEIQISDSSISTGDDCISMGPGLENINITNITCGPGHGISIGSLGDTANEGDVIGVNVLNCNLTDTLNGVRIKTWAPSFSSNVSGITFGNLYFTNVDNPIIIDQQYCPSRSCYQQASSSVQISDVKFSNIWGTSSTEVAVDLQCSESKPCQNVELSDINLSLQGGGVAKSTCSNVQGGAAYGVQNPPSCL